MTVATWYDWEAGLILVNMHEGRSRLRWMRTNPNVSLTALDYGDWYRHVSLNGSVIRFADDSSLADIDSVVSQVHRQAVFQTGAPSVSARGIEPHGWHGWDEHRRGGQLRHPHLEATPPTPSSRPTPLGGAGL